VFRFLYAGDRIGIIPVFQVDTMNGEKGFVMPDILRIDRVEIAFAKGKIMDRIQQVRLAGAVIPDKAIDLIGKRQCRIFIILKIRYR